MTELEQLGFLVTIAPTILLFLLYWIVLRPKTRLYRFRDDVFALRDEVFDAMHDTQSPFDDAGYVEFRNRINGTIRLSDSLDPLLIGWVSLKGFTYPKSTDPHEEAENECVRLILKKAEDHFTARVVKFVFFEHTTGRLVSCLLLARSYLKRRILWWRALDDNRVVRTFFDLAKLASKRNSNGSRLTGAC